MNAVPRHNINLGQEELVAVITEILTGTITAGPEETAAFERELASFHDVGHAIVLSSGRAALAAILKALNLPAGSEIVVPAYSFFTVPGVVESLGFKNAFAPCDPKTFAIDPDRLESVIGPKTSAVIAIHPFGQPAPADRIADICEGFRIPLIEDASQSIGAMLNGRRAGSFGKASCMSLVHGKNLMTFGGGVVLTSDDRIAESIRKIVDLKKPESGLQIRKKAATGLVNWALTTRPGFTLGLLPPFWVLNFVSRSRLDDIFVEKQTPFDPDSIRPLSPFQAKLGRLQLKNLDLRNAIRRHNAERIMDGITDLDWITLPQTVRGSLGTFNALPVRVADPVDVQRELLLKGVDTRADYMTVYAFKDEWNSAGGIFYLPNHPGMSERDVNAVISTLRSISRPGPGRTIS